MLPDSIRNHFRAIDSAYKARMKEWAKEIIEAIRAGEIPDQDALADRVHEEVDGSQWTTYPLCSQVALACSSNQDAYVEDFGEEGLEKNGCVNWAALAYCAVKADIEQELDDLGVEQLFRDQEAEAKEYTSADE